MGQVKFGAFLVLLVFESWKCAAIFEEINLSYDADGSGVFLHGVASHDPLEDSVLVWTRVSDPSEVEVEWAVWDMANASQSFDTPWVNGTAPILAANDYTIAVEATGLEPGRRYFYQFQVSGGRRSRIGRTKTADSSSTNVKMAYTSCTSLWSGYFNFYRNMAQREDLDFVVHLGDFVYPDVDPQEVFRAPFGLCQNKWFKPINEQVGGSINDNTNVVVRDFLNDLDCSKLEVHKKGGDSDSEEPSNEDLLYRYRKIHALYMLDPDFRDARANHPFIVTLDNHDLNERANTIEDGSRKAGHEWVPMRVYFETKSANETYIRNLRHFRFGDNLVDLIMIDTFSYESDPESNGILGQTQFDWLEEVLQNNTNTTWRLYSSTKQFMPFTLNHIPRYLAIPITMTFLISLTLVSSCVVYSIRRHEKNVMEIAIVPEKTEHEKVENEKRGILPGSMKNAFNRSRTAYKNSPRVLKACTCCGLVWLFVVSVIMIIVLPILAGLMNGSNRLTYLNGSKGDVWEGSPQSRRQFFQALKDAGLTDNNFMLTGDMHYTTAADLVEFQEKDLLEYNPDSNEVVRFGVELLPGSGSRGNLDEKLYEITGLKTDTTLNQAISGYVDNLVSNSNSHFRFFDGNQHGYGILSINRDEINAELIQMDIKELTNIFNSISLKLISKENKWSSIPFESQTTNKL